jgi:hypothetical protein
MGGPPRSGADLRDPKSENVALGRGHSAAPIDLSRYPEHVTMQAALKLLPLAAAFCLSAGTAQAISVTVRDTAEFVPAGPGQVKLDGFGRVGSEQRPLDSFEGAAAPAAAGREIFFDTWNIKVDAIPPGKYSFSNLTVDAVGTLLFDSIVFNSYDAGGQRDSILFSVNSAGTQAVGSGVFTVLASCPVASCVWIDVIGTQEIGTPTEGYGGTTVAVAVPEPAVWSSMLIGLAGLGWALRRRRGATA